MLIQKQLLEKLISLASDSAEYLNSAEHWITVHPHGSDSKGTHVLVKDGESNKEAIERKFGTDKPEEKKELTKSQIENKIKDIRTENHKIQMGAKTNLIDFFNNNPEIAKKYGDNLNKIEELEKLKEKAVNDIKTEPVLNLSVKLIEDTGGFSLKTRTINTEIKNPDKAKLKDYKSWIKREALKQNKGFRFHSFSAPIFEDKRV
jgi:kynurenine formamidase